MESLNFRLKPTTFFHRPVAIICQNENGPCPLIAIANVLTLRGTIQISTDRSFISLEEVIQLVADAVFEASSTSPSDAMQQQYMNDVLNVLPKLARGLDLNIRFNEVNGYEFTEEISIFDTLRIPLVHGWLYDPHAPHVREVIGDLSYNHLQYKLIDYRSLLENPPETLNKAQKELLHSGGVIDSFLSLSASQLTTPGLHSLYSFLPDRQLAIFFRNNHFSTLFAYQAQLLLLVTDLGYVQQGGVVWELLLSTDGRTEFVNEHFEGGGGVEVGGEVVVGGGGGGEGGTEGVGVGGTVCLPPGQSPPLVGGESVRLPLSEEEEMDPSLLLAMQLSLAPSSPRPPDPSPPTLPPSLPLSQSPPSPRSASRQGGGPSPRPLAEASPAPLVEPPEGFGGLTVEERDEQLALLLHYQELQRQREGSSRGGRGPPSSSPSSSSLPSALPSTQPAPCSSPHPSPRGLGAASSEGERRGKTSGACLLS